jgi:UDP-N-acetyl-D-mannosaminuronic acid dehydrogenase
MTHNDCHIVDSSFSVREVLSVLTSERKEYFGIAVIIGDSKVIGYLNDADIIRYLNKGGSLEDSISMCASIDPITVKSSLSNENQLLEIENQCKLKFGNSSKKVRFVIKLNEYDEFDGLLPYINLLSTAKEKEIVIVYGMGFVGLTLATLVSTKGYVVVGVDTNKPLIEDLKSLKPHIYEPSLVDLMSNSLQSGNLIFQVEPMISTFEKRQTIHVVTVGTPIENDNTINLDSISSVVESISNTLEYQDLVIIRSTVALGVTENFIIPKLEKLSGLIAGNDFHIAFCPERTVEGNAIEELSKLPQIIGGLTESCALEARNFFTKFNRNTVTVNSIKEAELIKLANNSFRDLSFAFSNGLSLVCDKYNIDSGNLIEIANYGYPRNSIPKPSPGVGGYCLTKDPLILASIDFDSDFSKLSVIGRRINSNLSYYPEKIIEEYIQSKNMVKDELNIVIIGVAFKGTPPTNDYRGSSSIDLASSLSSKGYKINLFDAVISRKKIEEMGYEYKSLHDSVKSCNVFIFMNNHQNNYPDGLFVNVKKPILIFDGWSKFNHLEFSKNSLISYSNIGYSSFR